MPAPQRRQTPGVIAELLRDPQRFGFFQAVRLLERWLVTQEGLNKLNFRNSLSLSFPASEIESLILHRHGDAGALGSVPLPREIERIDLTPAFMGLLGVTGTLPMHYTESLAQRELYQKDHAARAFLDVFSHRAVMLFYQAWKKHRLYIQFEGDRRQRFMPMALALAGVGQQPLRDRMDTARSGVADEALAFYAGTIQQRTLSARQLQQVLQGYLGVPVQVEQFVGRWYTVPESARHHLGRPGGGSLGRSAMLGERVWQRDLRMRLMLGPLDHVCFRRFLPGAAGALALRELLTLLNGVSLEYEVKLTLQKDEVRGSSLKSQRPTTEARLGWDTFLQTRPANNDRADVRYDIHAAA
ncbi:MAG: type VI secretion system baseplate subunit TssG [Burkholderiales bacterium]|nr:type VI secretion system baseplate subunit TssG [Burkholderiales bacterium]